MNEIATINQGRANLVDIRSNPAQFPRLYTYQPMAAISEMEKVVYWAFTTWGKPIERTEVRASASQLVSLLLDDTEELGTQNITFEEIKRAVKKMVLSHDMFGVNTRTLYLAIVDYVKNELVEASQQARERAARQITDRKAELTESMVAEMYANMKRNIV